MGKIELSPQASLKDCVNALLEMQDESLIALVEKINEEYEYWDMVKYKPLPKGCTPQSCGSAPRHRACETSCAYGPAMPFR